ncbi:MAG: immunoglobulin domain-containing protein, partial [Verrucomicrobiota bacterium]
PAGTTPLSCQWLFDSAPISGATATNYTVIYAQSTKAGSYSVVITNSLGSVTSFVATLTVLLPPSITAQPQSLTVTQSQSAAFSVTPAGTTPLSCQWLFNSAPIAGATATNYTVTNAQSTNAGSYSVVVTNTVGSITSSVATLTVIVPAQPYFDSLSLLADGSLQLNMSGLANTNYVLEFTSDWVSWSNLCTLYGTNGGGSWVDPCATNSERFYRLRLGP